MKTRTSIVVGLALVAALGLTVAPAQDAAGFKITSVRLADDGETVTLKFNSEVGKIYRVEISPSPGAGAWADAGVSAEGDGGERGFDIPTPGLGGTHFFRVTAATATPTGFALIPAGSFLMGDQSPAPKDGDPPELPVHSVSVSAFYMQTTEVTKAQWDATYSYAIGNGYAFDRTGSGKAADHPVQEVTWYDMVTWCNARSQQEGLTPCYYSGAAIYKTGQDPAVTCDFTKGGYRLPTEAEWEKAARGGLSGKRFPWGDQITHSLANYFSLVSYAYDTSPTRGSHPDYQAGGLPYTSPVGSFAANGYGLYDMAGNVREWCWDWYSGSYYSSSPASDPRGAASGMFRVLRGGSWNFNAISCRAANRSTGFPAGSNDGIGFRLARSSVP